MTHPSHAVSRLIDWLRIPSVSTDPAHRGECRAAAQWANDRLSEAGFAVELLETGTPDKPGHPIAFATTPGDAEYTGPHVLFYGHYDVQPPDPLDLWTSPPFEPVILPAVPGGPGERVVARGAVDDKGQVASFLEAMRNVYERTGKTAGGVRMTVLIEGEEESGSVNLERFVHEQKARLSSCDVCLVSDTGMLGRGKPAITYGIRGLAYTEVILHGPDQDLHSGMWGGKVPNPINELTKILAGLWDQERRVSLPGFYDDVQALSDAERSEWAALGVDVKASLAGIGLGPEGDIGETGYSFLEREWARPTCEINGIVGGYTGVGAKTVIPAKASAKISFRLVPDQHPAKVAEMFFTWLRERTPPGCRWEFIDHGGGHPATVSRDSEPLRAALRALRHASGTDAVLIKTGGSIPVAGLLKSELGLETIFMGFGLEDDRVHSPNEKFELACFELGIASHERFIDELRALPVSGE